MRSNLEYPYFSPKQIKLFMEENHSSPLKKWGQNFLIDPNTIDFILNSVDREALEKSSILSEIGCGLGALTHRLQQFQKPLLLFEIDPIYSKHLLSSGYVADPAHLVQGDFLKNIAHLQELSPYILGNLPYYISSEIFTSIMVQVPFFQGGIFMVQKEFGNRVVHEVSSLSIFLSLFVKSKVLKKVSASCFYPKPDAESLLLEMQVLPDRANYRKDEIALVELVLKSLFWGKRKTMGRSLKDSPFLKDESGANTREKAYQVLEQLAIPLQSRPDSLSLLDYKRFFDVFLPVATL
ncbi:MAG: 16S rRNA (adenine(1518)-N(6)/adenine(1519)-N(6))-dimethyltransferase RsmA [Spirochaetota bacterium]